MDSNHLKQLQAQTKKHKSQLEIMMMMAQPMEKMTMK